MLPFAAIQPARAIGYITIHNKTSYSVKVDVVFRVCRDDHPTIAPGGAWGTKIGLCHIKHITVTGARGNQCGPGVSALSSERFYIIEKQYPTPHCEVHTSI